MTMRWWLRMPAQAAATSASGTATTTAKGVCVLITTLLG